MATLPDAPGAYGHSEKHLSPPCSIVVTYRLSDKIKTLWHEIAPGVDVDLTFRTEKLQIGDATNAPQAQVQTNASFAGREATKLATPMETLAEKANRADATFLGKVTKVSSFDIAVTRDMIDLVPKMSAPLAATVMVQEQLGLALNRAGRGDDAEKALLDVIARRGPSSETYGLLGRVYKDRWEAALKSGDTLLARGTLDKAIDAYV